MFKIINQEKGYLEIALMGHLTSREFEDILRELKSYAKRHRTIRILLDFRPLEGYDKIFIDKTRFYDSMKKNFHRLAVLAGSVTAPVFLEYMKILSEEFRIFNGDDEMEAREWVFNQSILNRRHHVTKYEKHI